MTSEDIKRFIEEHGAGKYSIEMMDYSTKAPGGRRVARLFVATNGRPCEMAKRSRRRGYVIGDAEAGEWLAITAIGRKKADPATAWRKSWTRAAAMLDASGFWHNVRQEIRDGLEIGYDKIQAANKIDWAEKNDGRPYAEVCAAREAAILAIDSRLGNTFIRWNMSYPAKIKSMYFGKYRQEGAKAQILAAIASGVPVHVDGRASYDISLEYKPAGAAGGDGAGVPYARAWYSEEFKNCGNGHYYLALDASHALFYEDD